MRLGVVTPLANEEHSGLRVARPHPFQLGADDRVFCVLDHVSKDRTREMVAARADRDPRVVLVWAPENRCVVDAYFRGYRAALAAGCRWILEMDGGLSHQPEEIPQFIRAMEQGYDYVGRLPLHGARRLLRAVVAIHHQPRRRDTCQPAARHPPCAT